MVSHTYFGLVIAGTAHDSAEINNFATFLVDWKITADTFYHIDVMEDQPINTFDILDLGSNQYGILHASHEQSGADGEYFEDSQYASLTYGTIDGTVPRSSSGLMTYAWIKYVNNSNHSYISGIEALTNSFFVLFYFMNGAEARNFIGLNIGPGSGSSPSYNGWYDLSWGLASDEELKVLFTGEKGGYFYFAGVTEAYKNANGVVSIPFEEVGFLSRINGDFSSGSNDDWKNGNSPANWGNFGIS